jgi:hypothetical protein
VSVIDALSEPDWQPTLVADGEPRDGAAVVELTGLLDLARWPAGMRVIVRRERPHPGAQLRLTDRDGNRLTAFATNTRPGGPGRQLANLELLHRRRARAEDRIRAAKDTGLTNLPLHDMAQNRIWCAIVALACRSPAGPRCSPSPSTRPGGENPNGYGELGQLLSLYAGLATATVIDVQRQRDGRERRPGRADHAPAHPCLRGAAPRSPSRRASATPRSSPPADAPRSARRESILYWAAAGMVVSMIPVACEHRHRHCPSSARM